MKKALLLTFRILLVASLLFPSGIVAGKSPFLATLPISTEPSGLFRTIVHLTQAYDHTRLDKLGVTILQANETEVLVLATAGQLESLARSNFEPQATSDVALLINTQLKVNSSSLLSSLVPELDRATMLMNQNLIDQADTIDTDSHLMEIVSSLNVEQLSAIQALPGMDNDDDGLTDTQESWWCTDPNNSDTDSDGRKDGAEIQALKDWMANRREGSPSETPWPSWPFNSTTCPDKDYDSIPNLAERWELGLNMDLESTDRDKFDDGQEVFGVTNCPGGDNNCGYGDLPRSSDAGYIGQVMPSWVKAPGNHPLVAAYPLPEIDISPNSIRVATVTEITTDHTIASGTENSYSTTTVEGTGTSVANTVNWNDWEEVSETSPLAISESNTTLVSISEPINTQNSTSLSASLTSYQSQTVIVEQPQTSFGVFGLVDGLVSLAEAPGKMWKAGQQIGEGINEGIFLTSAYGAPWNWNGHLDEYDAMQAKEQLRKCQLEQYLTCVDASTGINLYDSPYALQQQSDGSYDQNYIAGVGGRRLGINGASSYGQSSFPINVSVSIPSVPTKTETKGRSWGGAQTNSTEQYEEHSITNGNVFSNEESWGNATAVNSVHAADLWFSYIVKNIGNDYTREISNLAFNIYLNDDPNPITTYYPGPDLGSDPVFRNYKPGDNHVFTTSHHIPLTLEQMKQIDLGGKLRIEVEDFSFGSDELFYDNALAGNIQLAIEDGVEDGNEDIDRYLIPVYGGDTVTNILARYFPNSMDSEGELIAIWTPEYRQDVPSWCAEPQVVGVGVTQTVWCKHALSTADWWNIYTDNLGDGSLPLQETPAVGGATALFRFNSDSDWDGYSDRSEVRLGTDPINAADFPQPELIAGVANTRSGSNVVSTLSLLNSGLYDAYGIEAVMIAPDDSITITNNTVGGSGRVKAGKEVVVGSRILSPVYTTATWTGAAKPVSGGYYSGTADKTYAFTVSCSLPGGCSVGVDAWTLNWNDGSTSGSVAFPSTYQSPTLLNVGTNGFKLAMLSGKVNNGNTFNVETRTPRDTFQYTINREPYTAPVVIVSYNDPQGNHRFVLPASAMNMAAPTQDLLPFSGQMLDLRGAEIVTEQAFLAGANSTSIVVDNPSGSLLQDSHLFLEFIDPQGIVVLEASSVQDIPVGPSVVNVAWNSADFSPVYDPAKDYIVMAFWTDYAGNILDAGGRPLSSFQVDPQAKFAMSTADEMWDFGTAAQGTLLKRTFTFANTGMRELLTYVEAPAGLQVSQTGSRNVAVADQTSYEMQLNTQDLPVGDFNQMVTIHTSDSANPVRTIQVRGTILSGAADTPAGSLVRPLDYTVTVPGPQSQGTWYTFTHPIGPDPISIHPVKVFSQDYSKLWGVGKYNTQFNAGTASYEMLGDGRDGVMPSSGNLDYNNGVGIGSINGQIGSTVVAIIDKYSLWRIRTGDLVLIHQTRGNGAGNWEINKVLSINIPASGEGTVSLKYPLTNSYITNPLDESPDKAQIVRIPQYSSCNISGTMSPLLGWNGAIGGIFVVACMDALNLSGAIINKGGDGATGTDGNPSGGSGAGFRGGIGDGRNNDNYGGGWSGEGTNGVLSQPDGNSNGNGGGAGPGTPSSGNFGTGGGGGNGTMGGNSTYGGIGYGGNVAGTTDLSKIVFGGGGGGSNDNPGNSIGGGGGGGGIVILLGKSISITGSINVNGGIAGGYKWAGGAGSGGSILLVGENVNIGSTTVNAIGGYAHHSGGGGGYGRIGIHYCNSYSGTTDPGYYAKKIICYMSEQIESTPFTSTRLYLPETLINTKNYQLQYGRRMIFANANAQTSILRIPAKQISNSDIDLLLSGVGSGSLSITLDFGNDGSIDYSWSGNVSDSVARENIQITQAINRWWAANGRPTSGTMDVPVKVSLSKAGQVLLTDLKVTSAGSSLRAARLESVPYTQVQLGYSLTGASGAITVGVDVGDDGSVDDSFTTESSLNPQPVTSANLAAAVNSYLTGRTGEVDIPVRFYLPSGVSVQLTGVQTIKSGSTDIGLTASDIHLPAGTVVESTTIPLQATLHNANTLPTDGIVATFFATHPTWGDQYIGSVLIPDIPAGGTAQAEIQWDTLGFSGDIPIRVVVDPYQRLVEANEDNNTAQTTLNIRTRPDLETTTFVPTDLEPVIGEAINLDLVVINHGQTDAGSSMVSVFDGDPKNGGTLIAEGAAEVIGGSTADVSFAWTPGSTGWHRLYVLADKSNQVNEYDESNNLAWRDIYIGVAGPLLLDSGTASDPIYSPAIGYGYVDVNLPDEISSCGSDTLPEHTLRRDPDGKVLYQIDHLQPGHFYHLDITLFECDGAGRQETILVDDNRVSGTEDLGDGLVHHLSFRLDPALYNDRMIKIAIQADGIDGAVVSAVNLFDIDYRYADAGGSNDPQYPGTQAFGWLDGSKVTSWGTLPYQSVRVDQSNNDVRYEFDNLDLAKQYNVHFTFWQPSGTGRIQKVQVDGVDAGLTVNTGDYVNHQAKVAVPITSYATDGKIIVSIVRTNATTGAMVNEIALEEETSLNNANCSVQETPYYSEVYGSVLVSDLNAPIGSFIQAFSPRGDSVGCFSVTTAGQYGFMRIFGEDITASPQIPGMRANEMVKFKVNGSSAVASPIIYWNDDHISHNVNLTAGFITNQSILLQAGWNLISFNLEPPTPQVASVLQSVNGRYDRVLDETGIYIPSLPNQFNTLQELHSLKGYYLRVTGTTSVNLLVEGIARPCDTPIALHAGWNWIGGPCAVTPTATALASISGQYQRIQSLNKTYDPTLPQFSTLVNLSPGEGYLIYMNSTATLTYPSGTQSLNRTTLDYDAGCQINTESPFWTTLYGQVLVNELPALAGSVVEFITPRGEVAGCSIIQRGGKLMLTQVYGSGDHEGGGFLEGEPITILVNGSVAKLAEEVYWQNDKLPHPIELDILGLPASLTDFGW